MDDDVTGERVVRRPIEEVLGGMEILPLRRGWAPLEAVILVKCLDADGNPSWAFRGTGGLNDEELLGVLSVRADLLRRQILSAFSED